MPREMGRSCQAKQRLERQASLDRGIGERGRTAPLAAGRSQPDRFRVKPDQQRTVLFEGRVVRTLVRRAVGGGVALLVRHD